MLRTLLPQPVRNSFFSLAHNLECELLQTPTRGTVDRKPDDELELRRLIATYFLRNPEGVDSLEGIARWRLLEEQVHTTVEQTHLALEWLVSHRYLTVENNPSAGRLYRLSAKNRSRLRQLVDAGRARNKD